MRKRRHLRLLAAAAALAAGLALAAAAPPAQAASAGSVPGIPAAVHFTGQTWRVHAIHPPNLPRTHLPQLHGLRHGPANITLAQSRNWSGYADQACGTCKLRFVEAQFSVPRINCTGVTTTGAVFDSNWAGLDGLFNSTVEQTGVDAFCDHGTPIYFGWFEMFPLATVPFAITGLDAGSAITASVFFDYAAGHYVITLTDVTQGVSMSTVQTCPAGSACQNKSAEVIGEAPFLTGLNQFAALADFGRAFFTGGRVTSRNITRGNLGDEPLWNSFAITMVNGADVLATPGPLVNGTVGGVPVSDFTDAWRAST